MMRRRPRKQKFSFPAVDQPEISDAILDADIDSDNSSENKAPEVAREKSAATANPSKVKKSAKEKEEFKKAVAEIPEIFTPEQVIWVFDVYVGAICFIFSILMKVEFKALHEELELDSEVKLMWAKPLARVLSKYAPSDWAGMTAEIELIACVGMWTATAFGRAKQVAAREKEKEMELRNRNRVTAQTAQPAAVARG